VTRFEAGSTATPGCAFFKSNCRVAATLALVSLLLLELSAARATSSPAQDQAAKKSAPATKTAKASPTGSSAAKKKPRKRAQARRSRARRPRGQQVPTPERIRGIQEALARAGHYSGEPTGKWDAATVAATKSFQQGAGLTPTGKLDALTLQKLGLGSPVAGLAPPRPNPAPAASSAPRP